MYMDEIINPERKAPVWKIRWRTYPVHSAIRNQTVWSTRPLLRHRSRTVLFWQKKSIKIINVPDS